MFKSNRGRVRHGVIGILTALLLQAGMNLPAFAQEVHHFEIDATDAAVAIHQFGNQSGVQILASGEALRGIRLNGISGEYSTDAGFQQLLTGTGLSHRYVGDRAVALVPESVASAAPEGAEPHGAKRGFWDRFRLAQVDPAKTAGDGSVEKSAVVSQLKESTKLEEIIVTATKRAQSIQDVPLSIAVVSADDIDRRGLVNAEDYLRGIPGVNQVDAGGGGGQAIVIRGLETGLAYQNLFSGATTATYFGETPTTGSASLAGGTNADIKLVDIERVEVLRGPQGTAFGNSAMGGAVRTIPVAPKLDRFEGKVAAGYSGTSGTGGDNYNVQAVVNIPIMQDKLAIRATGYQYQDSGFYRNRAGSNAAYQAVVATPYGAQDFAIDAEEVGAHYAVGGRIAAAFKASEDLKFTLGFLTQKSETDGWPVQTSGRYEQTILQLAPEHVLRGQTGGVSDLDLNLMNATMEYNLDGVDLLATYSHLKGEFARAYPYTAFINPAWPASSGQPDSHHRADSGEIRLVTKLDGAWNFLAGLYAEKNDDRYAFDLYWYGDPATNPRAAGQRFLGESLERRNLQQKAAFGEASWEFLPRFTLTGGVRYYDYDRSFRLDTRGPQFNGGSSSRLDAEDSGTTFRANLSYKPVANALLYAGWSQGFRLGKPQALTPGLCDVDGNGRIDGTNDTMGSASQVDSDGVDNYELGGKFSALDSRLVIDAAVFRMDWSDIPVTVRPVAGSGCFYLVNAGAAQTDGVEFQANFQFTDALRVDFGGSWIHAQLTKDVPAQGFSAGDRLPGSPKVNSNLGLQYGFEIAGHGAFVRADAIYVGPFYGDVQQSANLLAGDYVKLDTSVRVEIRNLNINLFVHNLTKEDAFTYRGSFSRGEFFGYRLRPRTIGIQLGYTF